MISYKELIVFTVWGDRGLVVVSQLGEFFVNVVNLIPGIAPCCSEIENDLAGGSLEWFECFSELCFDGGVFVGACSSLVVGFVDDAALPRFAEFGDVFESGLGGFDEFGLAVLFEDVHDSWPRVGE